MPQPSRDHILLLAIAAAFIGSSCQQRPRTLTSPAQTSPAKTATKQDQESVAKYFGTIAEVTALSPKYFIGDYWSSRFHAEGAWVMDEGKIAWEANSGSISCDRISMQCTDVTAFVFRGLLESDITVRDIERWDEHEIVTKPSDAICVRSTIRINREQQSVTEVQNTFSAQGPCKGLSIGEHHLHLEDGLKVANQIREQRLKGQTP